MKKIMLVCNAGMSTSMLVQKMKESAKEYDEEIEIFASPEAEAKKMVDQVDVVMLGPQVAYVLPDFEKIAAQSKTPVSVIPTADYGRMEGKKVLKSAIQIIEENTK